MHRRVPPWVAGIATGLALPLVAAAAQSDHYALHRHAMSFPTSGDLVSVSAVTRSDVWAIGLNTVILQASGRAA